MNQPGQKTLHFASALIGQEWLNDVAIEVGEGGLISAILSEVKLPPSATSPLVAIPGMINVHSHAFQRAFAGLSEYVTAERDSFWTWRSLMFDFLMRVEAEEFYQVARQVYTEMLAAGYTWVGEFHYVHLDTQGKVYSRIDELAAAMIQAAEDVGLGICLLPTLYQRGGFKNEPLVAGQRRFFLNLDEYIKLVERCRSLAAERKNCRLGVALHSLRAVDPIIGNQALTALISSDPKMPIHIHVAEQVPEVEACLETHGKRSVEYLFEQYPVNESWCLIHATHLADHELRAIVDSRAVVGLCPSTEANLGDGIFRARDFLNAGGRIGIGTDSNVCIDPREELRLIETVQRLQYRERAVLATVQHSVGRRLIDATVMGGAAALGLNAGELAVGKRCDMTVIDQQHPSLDGAVGDRLLDRFVFCNHGNSPIAGTVVGGNFRRTQDCIDSSHSHGM